MKTDRFECQADAPSAIEVRDQGRSRFTIPFTRHHPTIGAEVNARQQLKEAIDARQAAAEVRNQAQDALDRAGEYLSVVEAETAALQVRNQAEIMAHGKSLIESFRTGGNGTAPAESSVGGQLAEAERKYAAAAAAYAELERELAQACAGEAEAESTVRNAAAAVLRCEGDELAKQIRDAETRTCELREQLRAMGAIGASVNPGEKILFLSREAVDAMSYPINEMQVSRAAHIENAATWRGHFAALQIDAEHLFRP